MKKIFFVIALSMQLFASIVETPLISLDKTGKNGSVDVMHADVGMTGFVVKKLSNEHSMIVANVVVTSFDIQAHKASVKIIPNTEFINEALPHIKAKVELKDSVVLGVHYSRALLVAPSENIYYRIVKSMKIEWIHPDIFAALLSMNGHPTPLYSDFQDFSALSGVGLFFIYIEKKLYTLDIKSFKILNISDAPLEVVNQKLPFFSRVKKIEANWFGEGNQELKEYAKHYYKLLITHNKENEKLYEIVKGSKEKELLKLFDKKDK